MLQTALLLWSSVAQFIQSEAKDTLVRSVLCSSGPHPLILLLLEKDGTALQIQTSNLPYQF